MDQAKKALILKIVAGVFMTFAVITIIWMTISLSAANALLVPIEEHLNLLEQKENEAAYNLTSEEFKKNVSLEEFNAFIEANPVLNVKNVRIFRERIIQDNLGLVRGAISANESVIFVEYNLRRENGRWKIVYFKTSPTPIIPITD